MPAREALKVGTQGGAKVLGRDDIGRIAPGMAADFVAWRTDGISFSGAQHDLVAALLFCTPGLGPVDLSVINGDIIVKNGQMLTCSVKVCPAWKPNQDDQVCTKMLVACAHLAHDVHKSEERLTTHFDHPRHVHHKLLEELSMLAQPGNLHLTLLHELLTSAVPESGVKHVFTGPNCNATLLCISFVQEVIEQHTKHSIALCSHVKEQ